MKLRAISAFLRAAILRAASQSGGNESFNTLTVTGKILLPDGSAAAPSLTFSSDQILGLYWIQANRLGVAVNGGAGYMFSNGPALGLQITSTLPLTWSSGAVNALSDIILQRDAAGLLGIRESFAARGGAGFGSRSVSSSTSVLTSDFTINCSTATAGLTVLLPPAPAMNQFLNVKKTSADANRLTVNGNGLLIDGETTASTIATTRPTIRLHFCSNATAGASWSIV